MAIRLRLEKEQIESVGRILSLRPEQLQSIGEHWQTLPSTPLRPADLIVVTKQWQDPGTGENVDPSTCEDLVGQLLSLYTIKRRSNSEFDHIRTALQRAFMTGLTEKQNEDWKVIEDSFFDLLRAKVVRLTAMALELSYDYANLLRRTNIIADIRPLFNDDASDVEAAVVSYTLRLEYSTSTNAQDISIAIDQDDLVKLRDQCDRALAKAATIESKVKQGLSVPTTIPGQEANE